MTTETPAPISQFPSVAELFHQTRHAGLWYRHMSPDRRALTTMPYPLLPSHAYRYYRCVLSADGEVVAARTFKWMTFSARQAAEVMDGDNDWHHQWQQVGDGDVVRATRSDGKVMTVAADGQVAV